METSKVKAFLKEKSEELGKEFKLKDKRYGESNYNFIVEAGGEKYVLRVSRNISRRNRLKEEAEALEFLKEQGIENIPEKYWFGETEFGAALIETYVGEKDLDARDFNEQRLRKSAQLLAAIHSIDIGKFNSYFGVQNSEKAALEEIYREEYGKWSERPYHEYLEEAEDHNPKIKKAYQKQKELLKNIPNVEVERRPVHGDLGFNVRSTDEKIFFVDWEYFTTGYPGNDIVYFFEHEGLSQEQREIFLEEYRKNRELGKVFEENRERYRKFLAFNDAVWAAKRLETGEGDQEKMEKILEDKMEFLEEMHGGLSG